MRPLKRLVQVMELVEGGGQSVAADGDVSAARMPAVGIAELDELGRGFNRMLDALVARQQALEEAHRELELTLKITSDGVWDWDVVSGEIRYSARWWQLLGLEAVSSRASLATWRGRIHPEDLPRAVASIQQALDGRDGHFEIMHRLAHRDGHYVYVLGRGVILRDANGRAVRVVGTNTDLTALIATQVERDRSRSQLAALIQSLQVGVLFESPERRVLLANRALIELVQLPAGTDPLGQDTPALLRTLSALAEQPERMLSRAEALVQARITLRNEEFDLLDGRVFERDYVPVYGRDEFIGNLWIFRNITDRVRAARDLLAEKQRLAVVLDSLTDAVLATDHTGQLRYANPVAREWLRWDEHQRLSLEQLPLLGPEGERIDFSGLLAGRQTQFEVHAASLQTGGGLHLVEITATALPESDQRLGAVLVLREVSEAERLARRLAWQANHDALTGLWNRWYFDQRLSRLISDARGVVLLIDLDQFRVVNDACGHRAGDKLLAQIGVLLQQVMPEEAVVARLSGDEFGVLLPEHDEATTLALTDQLRERLRAFSFNWAGRSFTVSVSVGLVDLAQGQRGGDGMVAWQDAEEVFSAADVALYAAKDQGRNRVNVYRSADSDTSQRHAAIRLVSEIQQALREDRFTLVGQLVCPTRVGEGRAYAEVLVRMRREDGGLVSPGLFIPAAEHYNLMQHVDRWVLTHTLEHLAERKDQVLSHGQTVLAVNLSGRTLNDPESLDFVLRQLAYFGLPPESLSFEITETDVIGDLDRAVAFIEGLRRRGIGVALDDFGSGVSSFGYLKRLPVSALKIDGMFVRDVATDLKDRQFVQAMHQVGESLGLKTVAEFVENAAILDIVRDIGVHYAQGYHLAAPLPLEQATTRLFKPAEALVMSLGA